MIDAESLAATPNSETCPTTTTATTAEAATTASSLLSNEIQSQLKIANPTILGMLLYKLPWLWSLHFVATLGSDALAAAALATTICNVTGMSFAVGLSFGLATLTGQAKGDLMLKGDLMRWRLAYNAKCAESDGDVELEGSVVMKKVDADEMDPLLISATNPLHSSYNGEESSNQTDQENDTTINSTEVESLENIPIQPLVFLFRGLFVQMLFVVPIGLWWIRGIQPLLLFLGQGKELSQMTEIYLRILSPGLWCYSVNFTFTSWLQSINMADVPPYAALAGFVMHIPLNILLVRVLGFGYQGSE